MKKAKKIFISQIFFLITISLIANKAFFSHIHILPDGKIIVHSHPYSKKKLNKEQQQSNHSHTNFSFFVIDQSNRFDDVPIESQDFEIKPELPFLFENTVSKYIAFDSFFIEFIDNRGPPSKIS